MKVVVFTDCVTCAYCKKIKPVLSGGSAFRSYLGSVGIGFDWGDRSQDPAHYAGLKRQYGFSGSYPAVFVIGDNGKTVARFVARNYTAQKLITKIGYYCASCNSVTVSASKTKTCPTCKGSGVVAVLLALMLSIAAGCTATRVTVKNSNGSEWTVKRLTFGQKLDLPELDVEGIGRMKGYANDGGADIIAKVYEMGMSAGKKAAAAGL